MMQVFSLFFVALLLTGAATGAEAQDSTAPTNEPVSGAMVPGEPAVFDAPAVAPAAQSAPVEKTVGDLYDAKCEAGFNLAGGNAIARDVALGCDISRTYEWMKWLSKGGWQYGIAKYGAPNHGAFITAKNQWFALLREDIFLTADQRAYLFFQEGFEGNELAGLNWRFTGELGVGYAYVKTDRQTHKAEIGFQAQRENFVVGAAEWRLALVAALLGDFTINDTAKLDYILKYIPAVTDFVKDYRMESAVGLQIKISDIFAYSSKGTWAFDADPNQIPAVLTTGAAGVGTVAAKEHDWGWMNLLVVSLF